MKDKVYRLFCLALSIQSAGPGAYTIYPGIEWEPSVETVISLDDRIGRDEVIALYVANGWSSAEKPDQLMAALHGSHSLVTARRAGQLVGLGNAISDGHLVVYYPHMLVYPHCQRRGIGMRMMAAMQTRYHGFHQQMLTADAEAVAFYLALGFKRAGKTEPMWIYAGNEH